MGVGWFVWISASSEAIVSFLSLDEFLSGGDYMSEDFEDLNDRVEPSGNLDGGGLENVEALRSFHTALFNSSDPKRIHDPHLLERYLIDLSCSRVSHPEYLDSEIHRLIEDVTEGNLSSKGPLEVALLVRYGPRRSFVEAAIAKSVAVGEAPFLDRIKRDLLFELGQVESALEKLYLTLGERIIVAPPLEVTSENAAGDLCQSSLVQAYLSFQAEVDRSREGMQAKIESLRKGEREGFVRDLV